MYSLFFVPMLVSLIAILRPVEHPGLLCAYQLLAFHERKSQPVELIVVLTQHRLRHLIALAEQALHFLVDQCCHARAACSTADRPIVSTELSSVCTVRNLDPIFS